MTEGAVDGGMAPSVAGFVLRTSTAPPPPLRQEARMGGKEVRGPHFAFETKSWSLLPFAVDTPPFPDSLSERPDHFCVHAVA